MRVTAYECDACGTLTQDEKQAREHQDLCPWNKSLECCENCAHKKVMMTPRYQNYAYPVRVCDRPPDEGQVFNAPHNLGWCPNYKRGEEYK